MQSSVGRPISPRRDSTEATRAASDSCDQVGVSCRLNDGDYGFARSTCRSPLRVWEAVRPENLPDGPVVDDEAVAHVHAQRFADSDVTNLVAALLVEPVPVS